MSTSAKGWFTEKSHHLTTHNSYEKSLENVLHMLQKINNNFGQTFSKS